ncbi:MAG: hypothetical protein QXP20_07335, partial [Candidatus Bathyarchaeia archaeon]
MNPEGWFNSYIVNVTDLIVNGSIQHFFIASSYQSQLVYALSTLFFVTGYALILYKGDGKPLPQLTLIVLTFFQLVNGIYASATNLWLLPLAGLVQPNSILFFSFDFIGALIPTMQSLSIFGIQLYELFLARTVLLSLLLVHVCTLSTPKMTSVAQLINSVAIKLEGKWKYFRAKLANIPNLMIILLLGTLAS